MQTNIIFGFYASNLKGISNWENRKIVCILSKLSNDSGISKNVMELKNVSTTKHVHVITKVL